MESGSQIGPSRDRLVRRDRPLLGRRLERTEMVAVTHNHGGRHEYEQTEQVQDVRPGAGASPFVEDQPPDGPEDHDAGHVKSPARKVELTHQCSTHAVEQELEIPDGPGDGAEQIVHA